MTGALSGVGDVLRLPLALSMAVQCLGWAVAVTSTSLRHFDLFGALTFFAVVVSLPNPSAAPSLMVIAWCCRLGSFLSLRSLRHGEDPRFNGVLHNPLKQAVVWLLQGIWVVVCLLPVILRAYRDQAAGAGAGAGPATATIAPTALFLAGFALEVTADYQKYVFKSDPANAKETIRTGVWSDVRYPNYAGEIVIWLAIALAATADLAPGIPTATDLALSYLSPVFVAFLLICVSGIPPQEARRRQTRGDNEDDDDDDDPRARLIPRIY